MPTATERATEETRMSDVNELLDKVQDETVRQQLSEQFDALSGSQLRKERDEAVQENKTLKQEKRHGKYVEAGLPEGAYDIFDEKYDGDLTVESLQEFAKQKGFALSTGEQQQEPTDDSQQQQEGPSGDDRLRQATAGSIPPRDPSIEDQITQAEQEGDWSTVDRLNAKKLEAARRAS